MIEAPDLLEFPWLEHGFGLRDCAPAAQVRTIRQIHSSIVREAADLDPACEGDALISREPGVRVGVKTADCVPILLVDPSTRTVAAVHAGWRGSAANIVAAAVRKMSPNAKSLVAAVGPSIGVCCYEVGPDVARQFGTWIPEMHAVQHPVHIDLRLVNEKQLREVGVNNIWRSADCTFCRADRYYSFRRERDQAGRMISWIGIR